MSGEEIRNRSREELAALAPVQQKLAEGRQQIAVYAQALMTKYGDVLRLRRYAVVAIGFERLVWAEVQ